MQNYSQSDGYPKPLKRFGQNYLKDNNILRKIVDEISPDSGDNMIEIGPGYGALTEKLILKVPTLTSIEIDSRVIDNLQQRFPSLSLIHSDIFDQNFETLFEKNHKKLRIVGNIPYNITSPIIFKMIENIQYIRDSVLMVQLEVAKRMTAKKKTKDYGILAVLLQYFTDVKICFKVSPNVFYPKPKVESAVVHLYFKENCITGEIKEFFTQIVKAAFGKRRKILKNSLSNSIFRTINFKDAGVNLNLRAEQLDINDFHNLAQFAYKTAQKQGVTIQKLKKQPHSLDETY
jgi:16S rRNA (adenine1518-N6/adenine1519-N6)-dimethyltransferase